MAKKSALSDLLDSVSEVPGRTDGFTLRASVPLDFAEGAAAVPLTEGFSAHDLANRGKVLEQLSVRPSAALQRPIRQWVVSLPVVPNVVNPDELDELRAAVKLFRRWDASGVGGLKRKAVVGQLNAVAESVHDTSDTAGRARHLSIMAELAQLAGWMAYDHGLHG